MKSWSSLEDYVRQICSLRWNAEARAENIAGIDIDCVVKLRPDYYIIVEITENDTLSKVREDINRLQMIKTHLFQDGIYAKCYCVIAGNVTSSMIQSGVALKIDVLDLEKFENEFFNFSRYKHVRSSRAFGSCVNVITGQSEDSKYVSVKYKVKHNGKLSEINGILDIEKIIDLLWNNKKVILLGEFGCGKSRCIKELFTILSERASSIKKYPIAINLRDNWGLKTTGEIVRRHFNDMGLSTETDSVLRSLNKDSFCFLLDGFDEISTQLWSDEPGKLEVTRHESLAGVRDLIAENNGGVLITGREHYFNSDKEMLRCLGLDETTVILVVNNEFTQSEYEEFIALYGSEVEFPLWLPKRPLICSILNNLETEFLDELFADIENETLFWNIFIDVVCRRESKIKGVLTSDTIKKVLIKLSRLTRAKPANVGPVSLSEIRQCFEEILGQYPIDHASVMLQRLPGLGRYEAETENRRFVDIFILDGLRALDLVQIIQSNNYSVTDEHWVNPLGELGLKIFAQEAIANLSLKYQATSYLTRSSLRNNKVISPDILSSLLLINEDDCDFNNIIISDGIFSTLTLIDKNISNLHIIDSTIESLVIKNVKRANFDITDSIIGTIGGISDKSGLPPWISNCEIQQFTSLKTTAAIKRADLNTQQKIFVTIIKKTFFQRGRGRKEEALLRGLGLVDRFGYTDKILKLLLRESILERSIGDEGYIYIPIRKYADRMKKIVSELTLSEDTLWQEVSSL